jgi:hypothetical protein
MWKVSYDHGPHQSNTIKVKAKSQSHAWEVAKEVAKRKYGHARITSGGVEPIKEEVELDEASLGGGSSSFFGSEMNKLSKEAKKKASEKKSEPVTSKTLADINAKLNAKMNESLDEVAIIKNGRKYANARRFDTDKEANAFLEKNPEYGVLHADSGGVYVAKNRNKGTPLK